MSEYLDIINEIQNTSLSHYDYSDKKRLILMEGHLEGSYLKSMGRKKENDASADLYYLREIIRLRKKIIREKYCEH